MDRRLPISPIPNNLRKNLDSLKEPYSEEGYQGTKATDKDRTKDRTYHTRRDDDTVGNIKVDLKDNDSVIPYYFDNVIKPTVVKDGTLIDVPLIYGGAEIWKTVQRDGYYRDKESKIQVPLIMFKRNTVTKRRDIGNKLDGNQAHLFQTFEKKYNSRNQYDNFDILNNRSPEKEYHAVVVPDYVTLTYDCIIWTEYVENMNKLVEAINFASDSYWGDPNRWKFKATIDSFQNQTEVTVGGNRIVRTTFTLTLNGYLIPDVYNKALANKTKFSSVTNIKFTDEQFILQNAQTQPQPAVSTFTTTGPGALSGGGTTISAFPFTGNASINGSLTVSGSFVDFTGVTAISGSVFSGSFIGDGSGITGVTAEWDGSHVGNASITGSLIVTGGVSGSFEGDGSQITGVISSSYATTSSYAFYAVSASHEIIKEVSSSYADTASFAQSGNGIFSGSFSGSFKGNGSGLTDIPASGIVGLNLSQIASGSSTASISPNGGLFVNTNITSSGNITSANNISASNNLFAKQLYVENNLAIDYSSGIAIGNVNDPVRILNHITASGNISSSGTIVGLNLSGVNTGDQDLSPFVTNSQTSSMSVLSASFAVTASHLLNNPPPFPFTGDAEITGSLIVSGSFIPTGKTPLSTYNVIIGREAGEIANAQTSYNVFVGGRAGGNDNDFGDNNVLIGYEAGYLGNQTGNTSIGHNAGRGWGTTGTTPTTGYNTSIGYQAGYGAATRTTAIHNTLLGAFAGRNINPYSGGNGNGNVLIGYYAGYENVGDGNIIIGSGSIGVASMANQLRIGNGNVHAVSASLTTGDIIFPSTASATYFVGDGSQLTGIISSSYALTASYAVSASHEIIKEVSSSYADTASFAQSGNGLFSGSFSGSYTGDGSGLTGVDPFPFSGTAVITGSLLVSGSSKPLEVIGSGSTVFEIIGSTGTLFSIDDSLTGTIFSANDISGLPILQVESTGEVYLGKSPQSLYTTAVISSTTAATSQSIYSLSTSSYDGVFFDYTVTSASNARAGNIMSIWNGGNLVYTENSTTDIGSTAGVTFNVEISQSQAQLISLTDTAGWKIKTTIRSI